MIIDEVIQKIIIENLSHLRTKGLSFISDNKDKILQTVKTELKRYIDEHKEDVLSLVRNKAIDIMKELML